MHAIFSTGGKQYRIKKNQVIRIEKIKKTIGTSITFKTVLAIIKKKKIKIGQPYIKNASIHAHIIHDGKEKKISIIKFRRRKHYKKIQGHRQNFTKIKIIKINTHKTKE